ncbi:hypothetical protein F5B17DRAFT_409095 [Nemania serpens]|nr:hypothetical protein F5B17DRAFT_409095 [Nemania serpens]
MIRALTVSISSSALVPIFVQGASLKHLPRLGIQPIASVSSAHSDIQCTKPSCLPCLVLKLPIDPCLATSPSPITPQIRLRSAQIRAPSQVTALGARTSPLT